MSEHMKHASGVEIVLLTNILPFSDMLFVCWTPLNIRLGFSLPWGSFDKGHPFWGVNPQPSARMSYLSIFLKIYCCGAGKIFWIWLSPFRPLLGLIGLSNCQIILTRLVYSLKSLFYACIKWLILFPCQWLHWLFLVI